MIERYLIRKVYLKGELKESDEYAEKNYQEFFVTIVF